MKKMFDSWGSHVKKIPLQGLLCLFILCLSLPLHAQNEEGKININVKDASVKEVLEVLKKYNYRLVYSTAVIDACKKKITLDMKKATPSQVLDEIFKETNLVYKIEGNLITIKEVKKDESLVAQGVVKDENGEPIPGVSVLIKGTVTGTATDNKGNFQLKVAKNSALIFSFLGMETKTVFIESEKPIQVVMKEKTNEMEEVVITGYQKINKRESTSSIVTMKAEDIIEPIGNRLDQMLQGKIPGMAVLQQSSTVGASPKIRIRGSSSIIGNREPVWVLDGIILEDPVPLDVTELNSMDNVNLIGNAISGLNPEDIERIDVLKDASATAIYGVKAANGVIVITTKRGKLGEPVLRYTTSMSLIARPTTDMMRLMNSKERVEVSEEIVNRGLQTVSGVPIGTIGYEGLIYQLWHNEITRSEFDAGVKELKEMNTDWYKLLFRNSFSHSHTLSLSGATDKVGYYFSFGFSDQQGASLKESSNRFNFMSNLDARLFHDKLNVSLSLSASTTNGSRPYIDLYKYAFETSRSIPAYNEDGSYLFYNKTEGYETILNYNILNERDNTGRKIKNQTIDFMVDVNYKILSGLTFSGVFSLSKANTKDSEWANEKSYYITDLRGVNYGDELPTDRNFVETGCRLPYGGELKNDNTLSSTYTVRAGFNYFKRLHETHEIDVNVGSEARSVKYDGISTVQRGYLPDRGKKFVAINAAEWPLYNEWLMANPDVVMDRLTNVVSFYGTFTYTYDDRYTANFNIRTDGSNKFGQDKSTKFLPVWSAAVRWNIHNEMFFSNIQWMNLLALKGSYGVQGNVHSDQTPNLIVSMSGMDDVSKEYISSLNKLQNPYLKWEKTKSYNLALEFAFLNNRISGCAEYYLKKGEDQIITKRVSTVSGKRDVSINGGDVENKGWEFTLNGTPIKTKNFTWGLSLNMYQNYNKVTSKNQTQTYDYKDYLQGNLIMESKPLDGFYSYKFDGLDEEGLPKFKDIDEPDGISKEEMFAKAFAYSGKRVADFNGGFSTYFSFKGFTLNALFAFSVGKKVRLNNLYESTGQMLPLPQQNMSDEFVNRWRKGVNENTNIPALSDLSLAYSDMDRKYTISSNKWEMYNNADLRVVSGDFLRMRNISLSYNLPEHLYKRIGVSGVSLRLEAGNLWLWANKKLRGQDPEQMTLGSGTVPPTKSFTFGLNISL